jgi:dTDP-4-dehydrorhamnose reductase
MTGKKGKILITGSTGFVGSGLAAHFSAGGWQVVGSGRNSRASLPEFIPVDLSQGEEAAKHLVETSGAEVVLHVAGMKDVRWCEANPEEARKINALTAGWLAKASEKRGARFVFLSTDLVFAADRGAYCEVDIPDSNLVYGKTKAEGEALSMRESPKALVCRTGGVYGKKSPLFAWLEKELKGNGKVNAFVDVKNSPTYLPDLGWMIESLLQREQSGIFHACGSETVSRYEWFTAYAKAANLDASLIHPSEAKGRYEELLLFPNSSLQTAKIFSATQYRARTLTEAFHEIGGTL